MVTGDQRLNLLRGETLKRNGIERQRDRRSVSSPIRHERPPYAFVGESVAPSDKDTLQTLQSSKSSG